MATIGATGGAVVVRTDFSDDAAWRAIAQAMLAETDEGFRAYVELLDDRSFDGLSGQQVQEVAGAEYPYGFLIVVDADTFAGGEQTVLVVDLVDEPGRSFRAIPEAVQSIDNNLTLANMDFSEFADSVAPDGVFRGFA